MRKFVYFAVWVGLLFGVFLSPQRVIAQTPSYCSGLGGSVKTGRVYVPCLFSKVEISQTWKTDCLNITAGMCGIPTSVYDTLTVTATASGGCQLNPCEPFFEHTTQNQPPQGSPPSHRATLCYRGRTMGMSPFGPTCGWADQLTCVEASCVA